MTRTGDTPVQDLQDVPQVHLHLVRDPGLQTYPQDEADRGVIGQRLYFVSMVYSAVLRFLNLHESY